MTSWKCGDTGTGYCANNLDARLITESLLVEPASQLVFQHRIDAEISPAYPDSANGGGIVEISTDGEIWEQLVDDYSDPYIYISWEMEPEAAGYRVYQCVTPYGTFELVQDDTSNSYIAPATGGHFYYITWY